MKIEAATRYNIFKFKILPNLRRAKPSDYKKWLYGFLENGGVISNHFNYDMSDNFYIAKKSFDMHPLFGSLSISIIVPKGIIVTGNPGHGSLFFMDGFTKIGSYVPCYNNTI